MVYKNSLHHSDELVKQEKTHSELPEMGFFDEIAAFEKLINEENTESEIRRQTLNELIRILEKARQLVSSLQNRADPEQKEPHSGAC